MRHYEILMLVNPDQSNQITKMLAGYILKITESGGKIHRQEDWGKQQLAYQIKKLYKAHYLLLNVECNKEVIIKLKHAFKSNDAIVRSLITKCETAVTEKSAFLKNREVEHNNPNKDNSYFKAKETNNFKFDKADRPQFKEHSMVKSNVVQLDQEGSEHNIKQNNDNDNDNDLLKQDPQN